MSANIAKLASSIRSGRNAMLEQMVDEITAQYCNREFQCQTIPMEKRGRVPHRRPRTGLIALAAKRKILKRRIHSLVETFHENDLQECVNNLESVAYFLESLRADEIVEQQ